MIWRGVLQLGLVFSPHYTASQTVLIKNSRQRSIQNSSPLEGASARNSNEPSKWSVCFKFFTQFIGMIACIKYRIIMIRFMEMLIIHDIFQIYLVILSYRDHPFPLTQVLQILH